MLSYLPSIVYTLEGTIKDLWGFKATVICRYKVYMEMEIYEARVVCSQTCLIFLATTEFNIVQLIALVKWLAH